MQTMTEKLQKMKARIEELESKTSWTALTSEIVYRKVGTDVEMIITAGERKFSSGQNISIGTLPEEYIPQRGLVIPLTAHTNEACTTTAGIQLNISTAGGVMFQNPRKCFSKCNKNASGL